jgi:hypothetical protein
MNFFHRHHRFLFYSAWLVLALVQSASTELIADEAYYWVYSKFPAWGYFDHPPMIAVLIKAGYGIFHNELGVRLVCALLSTFTILITESLAERKNPFLFYTVVLSIAALQVAGFFAVPDTPLLFFTALFFYTYRSFIRNVNWQNAFLLAISIILLFYTKYHGLLIVFFAVLSNIKLLGRWQFWFAGLLVLLFYSPHLYWQWQHDWISFRYHLFESNVNTYHFSHTTDYLLGQLLVAGPIAGIILLPAAFLYKTKSPPERALKFVLIGIYSTFLLSSFRGKVEPNWTLPALVPMIVLSHQFIIDKISWIKPLRVITFISLLFIIAGRLYLVIDIGRDNDIKGRFHNNSAWATVIKEKTDGTPVVFYNSYQRASLFWFYSGIPSHSHNAYWERRNNYNFWPTESYLLGKKVYIADVYGINRFSDSLTTPKGIIGLTPDTMYSALGGIQINPSTNKIDLRQPRTIALKCRWEIPYRYGRFLDEVPGLKTELYAGVFNGKEFVREIKTEDQLPTLIPGGSFDLFLNFENIPAGKYDLRFGIKVNDYLVTHNSETIGLIIR